MLVLYVLALAGCASAAQPTAAGSSQPTGTQAGTPGAGALEAAAVEQSLALPDGKTLTAQETNGAQWQGFDLRLLAVGVGTTDPIGSAVGNHMVVSQEPVTLSAGPATLALVERSQPAAAQATAGTAAATQEYWLIVLRPYPGRADMNLAYVLQASFTGAPADARGQILDLAKGWKLPQEGAAG